MSVQASSSWRNLQALRAEMRQELTERNAEIDGVLLSALTNQHVIVIGMPGAAKTLMVRCLAQAIYGTDDPTFEPRYFETTLSPFSTPESLFGMLDPKEFEQGRYRFASSNFLQHAEVAYVDEIFNGNPGIMQATQNIINERVFLEGDRRVKCPLQFVLASTNVYPESGSNLEAFYDRFLLRYHTEYIVDGDAFEAFWASDKPVSVSTRFDPGDLDALRSVVRNVPVPMDIVSKVRQIRDKVNAALDKPVSDRRWRWCKNLLRAHAVLEGRDTVIAADLLVLQHALWDNHEQKAAVLEIISKIAAPGLILVSKTLRGAVEAVSGYGEISEQSNSNLYEMLTILDTAAAEIIKHCDKHPELRTNDEVVSAMAQVKAMHKEVSRAHRTSMQRASAHAASL